ncbi:MAG: hypothetical protein NT163_08520 [Chlorobiales bacterium]|nr:hypothetical protein [Chlorobiales bacterium]
MKLKVVFIAVVMALLAISGAAIGAETRTDEAKNTAQPSSLKIAGGWTDFTTEITTDELNVFNKAIAGLVGVSYKPLAVSTQIVAGINYRFFCNSKVVYPGAHNRAVLIHIYAPLAGDAHITAINEVTQ